MLENNGWNANTTKISTRKVTVMALLCAILFATKLAFGFVPGIEFVTSLFLIYAIFMPYKESLIIVFIFNILVVIFYGFGAWWLMYWPIFITNVTIGRVFKKWFKNKYVLASFAFLQGFSLIFWFYLSDLIWFGQAFAFSNIISAFPINLIEGFSNFLFCIVVAPNLVKILNKNLPNLWGEKFTFTFKEIKFKKINFFSSIFLSFISIFALTITFAYNSTFLNLAQIVRINTIRPNPNPNPNEIFNFDLNNLPIENGLLTVEAIWFLQSKMELTDTATVIIINNTAYVNINKNSVKHNNFAVNYLKSEENNWYLTGRDFPLLGLFVEKFFKDDVEVFSPKIPALYFVVNNSTKNIFSSVGISSLSTNNPKLIFTFTFDNGFSQ
ncbi:hypothetical protein [[Mycoplasma] mobile]|uniref:Uncharacterized protein n=1 Tax=Mycoplasma mobile (strain ATCC 43663 / 163K / NCTC 11711) TaxID=267748 RepID=Q6KIT1_MYCM1|nr:hypothetical protein [[Mycoplasma] mobile]AAT27493.1 hypothetical protein MMOB0070 [Mycoplasma mobile 163K]